MLKTSILQATGLPGAVSQNIATLRKAAVEASTIGSRLLVTPELFVPSYSPQSVADSDGSQTREIIGSIAAELNIWIAASTVEHAYKERFISASLFSPVGHEVTRYRKQYLFGETEKSVFTAGRDDPDIVDVDGWPTALAICFDVEFPEFVRTCAIRGAHLLLVPTALPLRLPKDGVPHPLDTRSIANMMVPTRALESQLFIAYANQAGPKYAGNSIIADPFGRAVAIADDNPCLLTAELNAEFIDSAREETQYLPAVRKLH